MSMPKFIKDRSWRSGWPEDIAEVMEPGALPDVPWKGQIARYKRIFQAMTGVEGVNGSLSEIEDLVRRMDRWSDRNAVYFSWPPTMNGWSRAVWATLGEPQGKEDMAWLMAGYGPSVRMALSERPAPPAWSASFQSAIAPVTAKEEPLKASPPAAPKVPPLQVKPDAAASIDAAPVSKRQAPVAAAPVKPHFEEPKEIVETRSWISGLLAEFVSASLPHGLMVERLDREIKQRIENRPQAGQKREAGWVEYEMLPAVAGLPANQMKLLSDLWPITHSRSFIDPQKTLERKRFWAVLEDIEGPARKIFVSEVLPKIIDSSEWSSSTRFQLAKEMFSWTKTRPEAFEERFALWQAWGGKLEDTQEQVVPEGNRFSKNVSPPETVGGWIKSNDIPAWNQAIEQIKTPRSSLGMN